MTSFREKARERAIELFDKNYQMVMEQMEWIELDIDETTHHRLVWLAKMSSIHSVELQLELCDHLSETYWNRVIQEIYDVTSPKFNSNQNQTKKNEN